MDERLEDDERKDDDDTDVVARDAVAAARPGRPSDQTKALMRMTRRTAVGDETDGPSDTSEDSGSDDEDANEDANEDEHNIDDMYYTNY